ncbi:hypothetical protein BGAPBR_0438 [Borreliella garinii PBr]|uniref:Uncharacterized protein n=1 Tax=Borreliella garinii PBr TaxID=498743 RepID=B7XRH2_BORGR|nr:hypothetical protein BGAPBR_0438 [Borreliella garinii PBr]
MARASALQAEGQGFESLNLHYVYRLSMSLSSLLKVKIIIGIGDSEKLSKFRRQTKE